jgi:hypothetical protein
MAENGLGTAALEVDADVDEVFGALSPFNFAGTSQTEEGRERACQMAAYAERYQREGHHG